MNSASTIVQRAIRYAGARYANGELKYANGKYKPMAYYRLQEWCNWKSSSLDDNERHMANALGSWLHEHKEDVFGVVVKERVYCGECKHNVSTSDYDVKCMNPEARYFWKKCTPYTRKYVYTSSTCKLGERREGVSNLLTTDPQLNTGN